MARSLQEFDSLPDRIRHSRQSDRRPIVVVEGPSDKRLLDRIIRKEWAVFPAGTRDLVAITVESTLALGVTLLAGLIDRDFDGLADDCRTRQLPVVSYEEADLEAALICGSWFDEMVSELASPVKLNAHGGVEAVRKSAITLATMVGFVRRENASQGWGINFDAIELHRRVDTSSMTLKVSGFCAVACRLSNTEVTDAEIKTILTSDFDYPPPPGSFRGKDALILVQLVLKQKIGSTRIEDKDVLPAMLRLTARDELLGVSPFPELLRLLSI